MTANVFHGFCGNIKRFTRLAEPVCSVKRHFLIVLEAFLYMCHYMLKRKKLPQKSGEFMLPRSRRFYGQFQSDEPPPASTADLGMISSCTLMRRVSSTVRRVKAINVRLVDRRLRWVYAPGDREQLSYFSSKFPRRFQIFYRKPYAALGEWLNFMAHLSGHLKILEKKLPVSGASDFSDRG